MIFRLLRLILVVIVAAAAQPSLDAVAQAIGQGSAQLIADQTKVIKDLAAKTDGLEKKVSDPDEDDAGLVDIRLQLEEISRAALTSALAFRPRLNDINSRIEVLGPPPAQGQQEPAIVANERAALASEKAEINAVVAGAQNLSIRVNGLVDRISVMRSELFRSVLTKRYELTDALSPQAFSDAHEQFTGLYKAVASWLSFAIKFKFQAMLAATLMALMLAVVLLVGGRRLFGRVFEPNPSIEEPSYLSRLSVAFWSTLLPSMALAVFLASTVFFFNYYNVLRGDIGLFLNALLSVIGVVFCVNRLTNAALEPRLPNWRLIPVETGPARWLVRLTTAMAVVIGFNYFLSVVNDKMGSPLSLTIARSFVATIVVGIILILMGLLRPFRARDGSWRPWPAWLRFIAVGLGLFTIATSLLGYIGLSLFVSLQVVVTGTVLITAYIGFLSARAIGEEGGFADTSVGRWLSTNSSYEDTALDQLGLVVSIAINLMIVLIFLPLTLLMWGFQPGDIQAWAYKLATGVTIGSVTISVLGILTGVVVFVIGYFLTRWFQGWLDGSVMARGKVDAGVRNSIRLAVGYAGVALAALVGISAAGIDLSNLALVAGALSLGIGFGLQNVVSNFVSGLILLAVQGWRLDRCWRDKRHGEEDQRARYRDRDVPAAIGDPAELQSHQQRGRQLDAPQQARSRRDQDRRCLWQRRQARPRPPSRYRARPSHGAEESRAFRAVLQFWGGCARIRNPCVPCRRLERQHRAERHPLRHLRYLRKGAHRDPVDAARGRRAHQARGMADRRRQDRGRVCRAGAAGG